MWLAYWLIKKASLLVAPDNSKAGQEEGLRKQANVAGKQRAQAKLLSKLTAGQSRKIMLTFVVFCI